MKALRNAGNNDVFEKNIEQVDVRVIGNSSCETNVPIYIEGTKYFIRKYGHEYKVQNLKVFWKGYLKARMYRFFFVSVPALLVAGNVYTFLSPKERKGTATVYEKEETIFSSDKGVAEIESTAYDVNGLSKYLGFEIVDFQDDSNHEFFEYDENPQDTISFMIRDDDTCCRGDVKINKDGKMVGSNFSTIEDYINLGDLENIDFEVLSDDKELLELFDRVVNILVKDDIIKPVDKKKLDSLTDEEMREIIVSIVRFKEKGEKDVILSKTLLTYLLSLGISVGGYLVFVILYVLLIHSCSLVGVESGEGELLNLSENKISNLFLGVNKVKKAFLQAERERIILLEKELEKGVIPDERGKLLTNYEKKLIKTYMNKDI